MRFFYVTVFLQVVCLCANANSAFYQSDTTYEGFDRRANFFLSHYDTMRAPDYYACAAKYARGIDVETADKNALSLLRHPSGDMFWMIAVMTMYLHGQGRMSRDVREGVKEAWKSYTPYRGDTENHWVQYYSALFLASEEWPDMSGKEWFNGKSSKENRDEAKSFLLSWMKETTRIGSGEFDSPDYFPEYFNSMLLLAQFSRDAVIKKLGKMMADYLLSEFAVESLDGQYVGGFSRVYEPGVYEPEKTNVNAFAYLYFGQGVPILSGWITVAALSSYRPPEIIYDIAHDRSKPYVHTEIKRVRNIIRYAPLRNPKVYKYDYITHDYALGSLQGGILQPIQQHTWGLFLTTGRPYTTIFSIHPYWSSLELGMFFPEETETMISSVTSSKTTYTNPEKWTGSSPYERTFQHKNTLIVLYKIPKGTNTDHIDGFFPGTLDTLFQDPSGWIIARSGDVYIGWYPLRSFNWVNEGFYKRLRSYHLENGLVLEVRSKKEIGSFYRFRHLLSFRIPKFSQRHGNPAVQYSTLEGTELDFVYPETRQVNGKYVDLSTYGYYKGRFLRSKFNSGVIRIEYKTRAMILDFNKLTIKWNYR